MLNYKAIEIFTSEAARYRGKPVADAVMQYILGLKIAARCIVTRGIAGCFENGEVATGRLEILSLNLPICIYIVIPAVETEGVLDNLNTMINDGIIAMHDLNVLSHRARNAFFPRQLMVRDVMTPEPKSVRETTSLSNTTRQLLSSVFTGLPVLDGQNRPIGVITQGDMIRKGGLPLRLGLLAESDRNLRNAVLKRIKSKQAAEVMTSPAVLIPENRPLSEAVDLMLAKGVKRLPVVDKSGALTGILSRLDIFRTVMKKAPDWNAFSAQKIQVGQLKHVGDILRRDAHAVPPETTLDEVIRIIDENDIQRVSVVDADGRLLGLISDRDLLHFFKQEQAGIWHMLAKIKSFFTPDDPWMGDLKLCLSETNAAAVMTTELVTVREEMVLEEAIGLMLARGLKRLPVVDGTGRFKGMISRASLLRTGFGKPD